MKLKLVLPKGRMSLKVNDLLTDSGLQIKGAERSYRPYCNDPDVQIKLLKAANIPGMVSLGQHDCGFAGLDWVREQDADVVDVLDLGFDPVRIVACIPEDWEWDEVRARKIIAVSEYRRLSSDFLKQEGVDFTFLRSHGATEVFPPEDADLIVDNTATGATLKANRLKIIKTVMESTTRFIANPAAMADPWKRERIENMALLFRSVLAGRGRVLLEMNCPESGLDALVDLLPAMKSPTISRLYRADGFSVKAAVPKDAVRDLIPKLRAAGATDLLETDIRKVIP